jgi:hypothetical protein
MCKGWLLRTLYLYHTGGPISEGEHETTLCRTLYLYVYQQPILEAATNHLLIARLELEAYLLNQTLGRLPVGSPEYKGPENKLAALKKNWPGQTLF